MQQTGRHGFQRTGATIARTLKKIAAHPEGRVLAAELAAKYRAQYPRRTAMIDELKRF